MKIKSKSMKTSTKMLLVGIAVVLVFLIFATIHLKSFFGA